MFGTSVIFFSFRIRNGISESQLQSLSIWTVFLQPLVVFVEIVHFLDCFKRLLEIVFNFKWQTTPVVIKHFAEVLIFEASIEDLTQSEENHRHMETC